MLEDFQMPTYSYRCTQCDHRFDIVQKFSDAPVTACPECGAPVKKIFHAAGVVFKGSGWYITDSRGSTSSSTTTSSKPDSASTSDSGAGTKTETASTESAAKAEPATKAAAAD
jgi:putative FmdB family regulatory protein